MELFSIFLHSIVGKMVDWAAGRILDVRIHCPVCGEKAPFRIGNTQLNSIECSNCHKNRNQFTNACDFTINKQTLQIGHAELEKSSKTYEWEYYGALWLKESWLVLPFTIMTDGLRNRTLVLESVLRQYDNEEIVAHRHSVLYTSSDDDNWEEDQSHKWNVKKFPESAKDLLICDARIKSEFKDVLSEHRRIIKPWKD